MVKLGRGSPNLTMYKEPKRYLIIDFETNGLPNDRVLPCGAYPTQVSLDAVCPITREIHHLYDSFIRGATSLTPWVLQNTPVTLELLSSSPLAEEVSQRLAELWEDGDVLVAHNAQYDLRMVFPKMAHPAHPFFQSPVICTMRDPWVTKTFTKRPSLQRLCDFFGVDASMYDAHDATGDTYALACCMQASFERGVQWSPIWPYIQPKIKPDITTKGSDIIRFGKYKGCKFTDVYSRDPDYCFWFASKHTFQKYDNMYRFAAWVRTKKPTAPT